MRTLASIVGKLAAGLAFGCLICCLQVAAQAQSGIKIHAEGMITKQPAGPHLLYLEGTASHLGLFTCFGEIDLVPAATEDEEDGTGVAAFVTASGDVLVGIVTAHLVHNNVSSIRFSWRDSVTFSSGPIFSTGRFARSFPPGLVFKVRIICISDRSGDYCYVKTD